MKTGDETQRLICERLRTFGFASEKHMKLYGEEIHIVSNPFPDGEGFAIECITRRSRVRRMRIPLSLIQTLKRELAVKEPPVAA